MDNREEFYKRITATFKIEANEGIQKIFKHLQELERNSSTPEFANNIEIVFREAHSLKGASRAVNFTGMETLCQSLETIFSSIKNNLLLPTPFAFNLINDTLTLLEKLIGFTGIEITPELDQEIDEMLDLLYALEKGSITNEIKLPVETPQKPEPTIEEPKQTIRPIQENKKSVLEKNIQDEKTIRISTSKLNDLVFNAEELLSIKLSSGLYLKNLNQIIQRLQDWNNRSLKIKPVLKNKALAANLNNNTIENNEIAQLVEFCSWTGSYFKTLESELIQLKNSTRQNIHDSAIKIDNFNNEIKKIVSVPFSTLLDVYPKIFRDLAKDLGKNAELTIQGDRIHIDRRILDTIHNPLVHILRNCIGHGIEKPEIRKAAGKNEKGEVSIRIEQLEDNRIEILIQDDGAGIDLEKIKQKYISEKNIPENEIRNIQETTLLNYVFQSGVSTAEMITELSGRGLGLAIVREKIEQLGGEITIQNGQHSGTTFKIEIPLTLVTFRGVHVRAGAQSFIFPSLKIYNVIRLLKSEINTIENKASIRFEDQTISLIHLSDLFHFQEKKEEHEKVTAIITGTGENRVAIVIDEIIDEEEILVKKLNQELSNIRIFSGATVLGGGRVVLIINVEEIIRLALTTSTTRFNASPDSPQQKAKKILIVEDSITSRMLLKNILETAGYEVITAVDGVDGFTKLKADEFDLVVTDVDMPRLNGFDLTAKIRADKIVSNIPVVLVTSLSKTEDREHGMEVGANAYIIKSNFDQSNLTEVIEHLI